MKMLVLFSLLSMIYAASVFAQSAGGYTISDTQKQQLIQAALEAQQKAYAPYSNYFVGAAILADNGKIYQGCNIENASYGLTNCAERTAAFKAASEGVRHFIAVAVATRDGGSPCGACRQVLNEFGPKMIVIGVNGQGQPTIETTLDTLLPNAFGPQNLSE